MLTRTPQERKYISRGITLEKIAKLDGFLKGAVNIFKSVSHKIFLNIPITPTENEIQAAGNLWFRYIRNWLIKVGYYHDYKGRYYLLKPAQATKGFANNPLIVEIPKKIGRVVPGDSWMRVMVNYELNAERRAFIELVQEIVNPKEEEMIANQKEAVRTHKELATKSKIFDLYNPSAVTELK